MLKSQLWASMGPTGESSTDATYDRNFSLVDRRQPAFSFGASERPSPLIKTGAHEAPIYMVPIEKTPQFCKYFNHGANFQSFGPKKRLSQELKNRRNGAPHHQKRMLK